MQMLRGLRLAGVAAMLASAGSGLQAREQVATPQCVPVQGAVVPVKRGSTFPGLYIASANLPRQEENRLTLECAALDARTTGANIVVPWSKIDRGARDAAGAPVYDWSYVEEVTAPWRGRGQKINLLLWGSAQRTFQHIDGEPATPAYVLAKVPTVTCVRGTDSAGRPVLDPADIAVPIHYHPAYQAHFRPLIAAFFEHFADADWVNYLRVGIGVGAESYPANGVPNADGFCRDEWEAAGFTPAIWRAHVLGMIDFIGGLRPAKPVVITLNKLDGDANLPRDMARKAVEGYGFGIGTQGATARAIQQYASTNPNVRCYADWCRLFERYKDSGVPLEIQTPLQSRPSGASFASHTGPLPPLIDFALARGVTSLELYPFEWFVANGTAPAYTADKKAYGAALTRAHRTLQGGGD